MNNVVRVDWRPSASDSFYFTFKDWYSDQRGSEITAGPAKWGFFNTHYLNTDRGISANYTKIIRAEPRARHRLRHPAADRAVLSADARATGIGSTATTSDSRVGQFHPELNPRNVIPKVTFNVPNPPNFTFDNRLVDQGVAWLTSVRTNLTWIKGSHSLKGGFYFEQSRNSEGNGGVGAGPWAGQFTFNTDTNNPVRHQPQLRQRAHRLLPRLHGDRRVLRGQGQALHLGVLPAGHVEGEPPADARLRRALPLVHAVVLDAAGRGLRARALRSGQGAAALSAGADQQRERRARSGDRTDAAERLRRHVRAGHGRPLQRHGDQRRPQLPEGLPRQPGDRAGAAARRSPGTSTGDARRRCTRASGCTTTRTSTRTASTRWRGTRRRRTRRASSTGRWTRCSRPGAQGAFSNRPSDVFGIERDAKTPKSYNYSVGVQRELGWGTVLDVTYAGFQMRNARDGQRASTRCPTARASSTSIRRTPIRRTRRRRSRRSSCGPYLGYQDITIRAHFGTGSYNSLQVQLNRRYIRGLQFAVAYTLRRPSPTADRRSARLQPAAARERRGTRARRLDPAPQPRRQLHLGRAERQPDVEQRADARAARRLAALRRHRVRQRRLVGRQHLDTTDNFDFTGGDGGTRPSDQRRVGLHAAATATRRRAERAATSTSAAFSRPTRTRRYRQRAGARSSGCRRSCMSNMSIFKNFPIGGSKRIQFRWEVYNVFNQVNWSAINTNAQFNPQGQQVNASFGQATAARAPRDHAGGDSVHFLRDERANPDVNDAELSLCRIRCSAAAGCVCVLLSLVRQRRAAPRIPTSSSTRATKGPGAGKHIVFLAGRPRIPVGGIAAGAGADPRAGTTGSSAACSSRPIRKTGFIEPGSSQHRRARGAARPPTCWSSSCASRIFPTTRCSTSSTTWIAAGRSSASARRRTRSRSSGRTRSS